MPLANYVFGLVVFTLSTNLSFAAVPAIPKWLPVGEARLTVFWFDIYDAKLSTPTGQYLVEQDLKLSLTYLRDFDAEDLISETFKQMQPKPTQSQIEDWKQQLTNIWPDVKESQQLSFVKKNNSIGQFFLNDRYLGAIEDEDFNRAFADIWLSDSSNYPELAKKLTGKPHD